MMHARSRITALFAAAAVACVISGCGASRPHKNTPAPVGGSQILTVQQQLAQQKASAAKQAQVDAASAQLMLTTDEKVSNWLGQNLTASISARQLAAELNSAAAPVKFTATAKPAPGAGGVTVSGGSVTVVLVAQDGSRQVVAASIDSNGQVAFNNPAAAAAPAPPAQGTPPPLTPQQKAEAAFENANGGS